MPVTKMLNIRPKGLSAVNATTVKAILKFEKQLSYTHIYLFMTRFVQF